MPFPRDYNKFRSRIVYLWEDNEALFVRFNPNGTVFGKFPHGREFMLEQDSNTAWNAMMQNYEVTKEQYDKGDSIFLSYPRQPQHKF